MIDMPTIESIRDMSRQGHTNAEIQRRTGVSLPTIRKYLATDDFSPQMPVESRRGSILDPYKPFVDSILEDDRRVWRKQRHSAQRIYERLLDETPYAGGYGTVKKYVRERKAQMRASEEACIELVWAPGEARADFGNVDVVYRGERVRMHFFALSFPFSNMGFCQLFAGETSECVCQGLKDVFEHVGGVPHRIVFDNATGAGRKIGGKVTEAELFSRMHAHYGFSVTYANPDSGHEKGNVERKVGWSRRHMFAPMPSLDDIAEFNAQLMERCDGYAGNEHYEKRASWGEAVRLRALRLRGRRQARLRQRRRRPPLPRVRRNGREAGHRRLRSPQHRVRGRCWRGPRRARQAVRRGRRLPGPRVPAGTPRQAPRGLAQLAREGGAARGRGRPYGCHGGASPLRLGQVHEGVVRVVVVRRGRRGLVGGAGEDRRHARGRRRDDARPHRRLRPRAGPRRRPRPDGLRRPAGARCRMSARTELEARARAGFRAVMLSNHTAEKLASESSAGELRFLCSVFDEERSWRERSKRERLLKRARFPVPKSFDGYDWSRIRLPEGMPRSSVESCAFIGSMQNLALYGGVGSGKTHMAIACGTAACNMGPSVMFTTISDLVARMQKAEEGGSLGRVFREVERADLVILDELGYLPIDRQGARLLFQVVSKCYERRSLIVTTNFEFSRWGSVLTDDQMAAAMIDRIIHYGHLIVFEGPTKRMEASPMASKR